MSSKILVACFLTQLKHTLSINYAGEGRRIANDFYIPVLKSSHRYDRISGYFSIDSLVITATGVAGLINNGGTMRLILGAHDFGGELEQAYHLSRDKAKEIVETIGNKIANNLITIEDVLYTKRLEAIAWMLVEKKLEIKVAIPSKTFIGSSRGIFHEKSLIFYDDDNCEITAIGSTNESRAAWEVNGENLTVFQSWETGVARYIQEHKERFELLWNGSHKDYFTFDLPQAISQKLPQRFYHSEKPRYDPLENFNVETSKQRSHNLVSAAQLVLQLGNIKGLAHLGLGPVSLYSHQAYVVEEALKKFPFRILLADEVGLGKTLEAGAIIKRLIDTKQVSRVCILTPKNVSKQWLDEMWSRFGLNFSLIASNPKRLLSSDNQETSLESNENPFDKPGHDLLIASWHYARGTKNRPQEILQAKKFFDLIVIDEAHAARRRWSQDPPVITKLKGLADELSATSPHIILMSATPIQLDEREALDMVEILGIGGKWIHESNFKKYYEIIKKNPENVAVLEWIYAMELASFMVENYISDDDLKMLLEQIFPNDKRTESDIRSMLKSKRFNDFVIRSISNRDPSALRKLLIALNPMNWFMIRNTRERLSRLGYVFPTRKIEEIDVHLNEIQKKLLLDLDEYLKNYYGKYERILTGENKGIIGFVRSIYHQRFVSSFAAAYFTINNRLVFLTSILEGNEEMMKQQAEKLLEDEDLEEDEEDLIINMKKIVEANKDIILQELKILERLKSRLLPYSPFQMFETDPKMSKVFELVKKNIDEGRKVIIFSKYTDTIYSLRKYITKSGLASSRIGLYTGEGGKIFDQLTQEFTRCSKEDVRKALDEGLIDILLCSDAAAEGLNLQSASVIINVDMPWNPARVEQRIGRIDRLGQKSPEVIITNIWYPESIEAKIYKILFERKEIYKLVVGPAQEIVSNALKHSLDSGGKGAQLEQIISKVQQEIEDIQQSVIEREGILEGLSWNGKKSDDDEAILLTARFLKMACIELGCNFRIDEKTQRIDIDLSGKFADLERWNKPSIRPGETNTLTPSHPVVTVFAEELVAGSDVNLNYKSIDKSIYTVTNNDGLKDLLIVNKGISTPEICNGSQAIRLFKDILEKVD